MAEQEPGGVDPFALNLARQRIMARFQCSEEEATERLLDSIQSLFNEQGLPDPPLSTSPAPPAPTREPSPPPISLQEEEPRPPSKKKATYIDFELNTPIASRIPHNPSEYAVGKMEDIEYVELWYFTTEGCKEASHTTTSVADDTFGILNTKTGLALQPIKATKASRNAIVDEHLTWEQIMTARHTLIETATKVGWDNKLVLTLAKLYVNLEGLKAAGYSSKALILYDAITRNQWHEALKGRGTPFDLCIINEELFTKIENQVRDQVMEDVQRQNLEMLKQTSELQRQASNDLLISQPIPRNSPFSLSPTTPLRHHPLRYATLHPFSRSSPHATPLNSSRPHRSSSTIQLATASRRDTVGPSAGYRDRGGSRKRGRALGRPRSSRSRSPKDNAMKPRFRRPGSEQETFVLSACPICLSRKRHQLRECQATTLWDGQHKTRCSRTDDGRIIDNKGRILCSNWNQSIGCKDKTTRHIHECSGCGDASHGAQECTLAEKANPSDPARR